MKEKTLYAIAAPSAGLVKIGVTTDLLKRVKDIAFGSPVPVFLVASCGPVAAGDERAVHHHFRHLWSHSEWFRHDAEIEDFCRAMTCDRVAAIPYPPTGWYLPYQLPRGPIARRARSVAAP